VRCRPSDGVGEDDDIYQLPFEDIRSKLATVGVTVDGEPTPDE